MEYLPVIGLEVHAELLTRTKMFCSCPVVDTGQVLPNSSVCPTCLGLPGALPVVNRRAVELGCRVAYALGCTPAPISIFARKNYFYPDLPKGYQISQYEQPLAGSGIFEFPSASGERSVRIRRVHLEEDTGKLTHLLRPEDPASLVDLNRAGVPLLEIVTEPDLHNVEDAKAYASALQQLLRYLGVCSGDMEKGAIRFEANISLQLPGSSELGTRTEVKNLNSFKSMEKAITYEIQRQAALLRSGGSVRQETVGWDEAAGVTFPQRSKEEAHDYRYFPDPDLPPLVLEPVWLEGIRKTLPELPLPKARRFFREYGLSEDEVTTLLSDLRIAEYFEQVVRGGIAAAEAWKWITGPIFWLVNSRSWQWETPPIPARELVGLVDLVRSGVINLNIARQVLAEMADSGKGAAEIATLRGLQQVSDTAAIEDLVRQVLEGHPEEVKAYLEGKEGLAQWFIGQVMRRTGGRASPALVKEVVDRQLHRKSSDHPGDIAS